MYAEVVPHIPCVHKGCDFFVRHCSNSPKFG